MAKQNRITRRQPIRVCESCGRKYRLNGGFDLPYCRKCIKGMEEDNMKTNRRGK